MLRNVVFLKGFDWCRVFELDGVAGSDGVCFFWVFLGVMEMSDV